MLRKVLLLCACIGIALGGYIGEHIQITTDLNHTLWAALFVPNASTFPGIRPAIVVAHGTGGLLGLDPNTNLPWSMSTEYQEWGALITSKGYVALMVDSYLPISGRPTGIQNANSAHIRTYDLYAGRAYLTYNRTDVNTSDISLLGISHGSTAMVAALEDSDPHFATLRFKAGVGYYACCGSLECNRYGYTCSSQQCSSCTCSLCNGGANPYCPYAPILIFAADRDANCDTGYSNGANPGYAPPVNKTWGQNQCDDRILLARSNIKCPLVKVEKKFKMITYKDTSHGFDYLDNSAANPNNECARAHSREQTFNWIENTQASILGSSCAQDLFGDFLPPTPAPTPFP